MLRKGGARRRPAAISPIATLEAMRRVALILLLALLPFQSLWAAATSACPHERAPAGTHGAERAHAHAHAHRPAHEHPGTAAIADKGSADTHSHSGSVGGSSCHGQAYAAVIDDERVAATPTRAGIVSSPYARFVADRYPESPLRPPVQRRA